MSNWREIARIKALDAAEIRALASGLLAQFQTHPIEISEQARQFLRDICGLDDGEALTSRQAEFLASLVVQVSLRTRRSGYTASKLLGTLSRMELDEADEEWISSVTERGQQVGLTDPEWAHLFSVCRRADLIDHFVW